MTERERGTDARAVFEFAMMFGQGTPVYGYSSAAGEYEDRVSADAYEVEDFGGSVNLMITGALRRFVCLPEHGGDPLPAFSAFEHLLAEIQA